MLKQNRPKKYVLYFKKLSKALILQDAYQKDNTDNQ